MQSAEKPVRHGWVWLTPNWLDGLRAPLNIREQSRIEAWRVRGAPFVIAAMTQEDRSEGIRLGLATPDKQRIGFHLDHTAVSRVAPPPSLEAAARAAPDAWRTRLGEIVSGARRLRISVSAYGSLAWTYRSGVTFVRADSDLDLLLRPCGATLADTYAFLGELIDDDDSPRLDGELLLNDVAVAWREFAQRPEKLLVKGATHPSLQSRAEVEARFTRRVA